MQKYIDSHCHYNLSQFDKNRSDVLEKVSKSCSEIINIGTNKKSNKEIIELTNNYNFIYGIIGFFPCDVLELTDNDTIGVFLEQLNNDKIKGIGEIGLDYHWNTVDKTKQQHFFKYQLDIASRKNLPVSIHSRDAKDDTMEILYNKKPKGVIHCFSYDAETAKRCVDLGLFLGIGGTYTYKNNKLADEVLKAVPLEKIILETDAPYLTPEPLRGQINESSNISYVIKKIAEIKEISESDVIKQTNINVKELFKI